MGAVEHMRASVCAIVSPYGSRLAEVDSLCLQSGAGGQPLVHYQNDDRVKTAKAD